jgi:biopolymer transport protein ExbD
MPPLVPRSGRAASPPPRRPGTPPPRSVHEVNVTPLIDVSLVLVVMLLLATPLALESSFAVRDAAASARTAPLDEPVERVELSILSEDEVRVNRDRVPANELGAALSPLLAGEAPPIVVVTCADVVSHGTFVRVLDTAKLCGAREIAVTEEDPR